MIISTRRVGSRLASHAALLAALTVLGACAWSGGSAVAQVDPELGLNGLPRGVDIGDVPDFTFDTLDGQEINPLTHQGKLVVLDFWATWCGPCVASMPHMKQLYSFYHELGVEVYGLSLDQDPSVIPPFVERHQLPWAMSQGAGPSVMAQAFSVTGIPTCFVLGPEGVLLWRGHPMALTDAVMSGLVEEHLGVDVPSMGERAMAEIAEAEAALEAGDLEALMGHVRTLSTWDLEGMQDGAAEGASVLAAARALYGQVQAGVDREAFVAALGEDEALRVAWVLFYRQVHAEQAEAEGGDADGA